ncbi:MAG: DUF1552 domain-containing protein [Vicinamibacterales bacterium]
MFLTGRALTRRHVLKGVGAAVALPVLDAMTPAGRRSAAAFSATPARLVCIEMVHGAAGSSAYGRQQHLWAPAAAGRDFDLTPTSLAPLEPFRRQLTIVSGADVPSADPTEAREIGGDHYRSSATFLTQSYPKRTERADVRAGVSLDQLYASRVGQDTPVPSLQLCIEGVDGGGGCEYGYSCVYADTISWATPTTPLPMTRDPRVVFDQLFGDMRGGTPEARRARRQADLSLLDAIRDTTARLMRRLGAADRARLGQYLDTVREIERRLQVVERRNGQGEPRELPGAPAGVPDDYGDHVGLMFDLMVLAFRSDLTRVVAFKMSRDGSNRVFSGSGSHGAFHLVSHHSDRPEQIQELARINRYHVGLLAPFLHQLREAQDGEGTLLDRTVVLYGSPMGDPNRHNHRSVPFALVGGGAVLPGGRHVAVPPGTPLSNVMLGLLHAAGLDDLDRFGDSEGVVDLA